MGLDFKQANAILARDIAGLCAKFLPKGRRTGDWWLASTPWRVDKNPSLVVNLTSGKWKDLGRPDDRGDLVDLIARCKGVTAADVVRSLV